MMEESRNDFWQGKWGDTYDPERKRSTFQKLFRRMERDGKIGDVVVDIGSGSQPISGYLPHSPKRKIITVDMGGPTVQGINSAHIRYDLGQIQNKTAFVTRKALIKISGSLGAEPRSPETEHADTFLFFEILNYVDYKAVLSECATYLKVGGRFIIFNKPNRGFKDMFSEEGIKGNKELADFISSLHFEIEELQIPNRHEPEISMMFMIARKLPPSGKTV